MAYGCYPYCHPHEESHCSCVRSRHRAGRRRDEEAAGAGGRRRAAEAGGGGGDGGARAGGKALTMYYYISMTCCARDGCCARPLPAASTAILRRHSAPTFCADKARPHVGALPGGGKAAAAAAAAAHSLRLAHRLFAPSPLGSSGRQAGDSGRHLRCRARACCQQHTCLPPEVARLRNAARSTRAKVAEGAGGAVQRHFTVLQDRRCQCDAIANGYSASV